MIPILEAPEGKVMDLEEGLMLGEGASQPTLSPPSHTWEPRFPGTDCTWADGTLSHTSRWKKEGLPSGRSARDTLPASRTLTPALHVWLSSPSVTHSHPAAPSGGNYVHLTGEIAEGPRARPHAPGRTQVLGPAGPQHLTPACFLCAYLSR